MIGWLTFGKINELLKSAALFLFSLQHQLKKFVKLFFLYDHIMRVLFREADRLKTTFY